MANLFWLYIVKISVKSKKKKKKIAMETREIKFNWYEDIASDPII